MALEKVRTEDGEVMRPAEDPRAARLRTAADERKRARRLDANGVLNEGASAALFDESTASVYQFAQSDSVVEDAGEVLAEEAWEASDDGEEVECDIQSALDVSTDAVRDGHEGDWMDDADAERALYSLSADAAEGGTIATTGRRADESIQRDSRRRKTSGKDGPASADRPAEEDGVVRLSPAKHATTEYRIVERVGSTVAWAALYPITGRTHQIRCVGWLGDGFFGCVRGVLLFVDQLLIVTCDSWLLDCSVHCASALDSAVVGDFKYGVGVNDAIRVRSEVL